MSLFLGPCMCYIGIWTWGQVHKKCFVAPAGRRRRVFACSWGGQGHVAEGCQGVWAQGFHVDLNSYQLTNILLKYVSGI